MMRKALLIGGATSSIIFPQYVVNSWPNLFLALTPSTRSGIPGCTGNCGICGGVCLTSISSVIWLGFCAILNSKEKNK